MLRVRWTHSRMNVELLRAVDQVLKVLTAWRCVADQNRLVVFGATVDQRCDHGSAHAAPNIAHEVDHASNGIALLRRHPNVRRHGNRHEKETDTNNLSDAQPRSGNEADRQVYTQGRVVHPDGQAQPAKSDDVAGLELGGELPDDRHGDHQDDTAAREDKSRQFGRISHQCLEIQGHHYQTAEQQDSQVEHHQVRTQVIETFEKPNLDDRVLA